MDNRGARGGGNRRVPVLAWALLAGGLAVRAWAAATVLSDPALAVYGNDALVHEKLAANLAAGRGLVSDFDGVDVPSITRVPVYPSLVASAKALCGARYAAALIVFQNALSLLAAAALWEYARRRVGERAALIVLAVMVGDVPAAVFSQFLLTEPVYLFLSVAAFVLCAEAAEGCGWGRALWGGAVSALATLCRPIHFLVPFLLASVGLWAGGGRRGSTAGRMAVFLAAYCAGVAPWIARNRLLYGSWELTHLNVVHLYLYKAGGTIAVAEGRDVEEVKAELEERARREYGIRYIHIDPRSRELVEFSRRTIAGHPWAFARSTAMGAAGNALMPEKGGVMWLAGRVRADMGLGWSGGGGASASGVLGRLGPWGAGLAAWQLAVLLWLYGAIGYGVARGRYRGGGFLVCASFLCAAYFVLVPAGPESTPRFRIPAVPYLALLAAVGAGGAAARRGREREGRGAAG